MWYSSVCESSSIKSRLSVNDWYCMNVWNTSQIPKEKAHMLQSYNPATCFFSSCRSKAVISWFKSLYHFLILDEYYLNPMRRIQKANQSVIQILCKVKERKCSQQWPLSTWTCGMDSWSSSHNLGYITISLKKKKNPQSGFSLHK